METQKVSESVLYPLCHRLGLGRTRMNITLGHVLLRAYTEVTVDGAAAHGARLQLRETGGADAGVSTGQERP